MTVAPFCSCSTPQAFDGDDTCNRCGRTVRGTVTLRRLDYELARIALAHRRLNATGGRPPRRP